MTSSLSLPGSQWARILTFGAGLAFLTTASASASPVFYTGEDVGATPGSARPSSLGAAASFDAAAFAIGNLSFITFEGQPVGTFNTLHSGDVTITGSNYLGADQTVADTTGDPSDPSVDGYNVTPGGSNYVEMDGGTLTFTFATPVQYFGVVLTGVQSFYYQDTVTFSDGTLETINVPETGTSGSTGATDFVGFTDAGAAITSVTITAGQPGYGDFIGVDDVRYEGVAATPEPGSFALLLTGMSALGVGYRRLRSAR